MKYVTTVILVAASAGLLVACQASGQHDGLVRTVTSAIDDNVVTPDEVQLILAQLPKPGFDWLQAVQVVGSIGGALLGVKLLPDRHLRSPFEASASQPKS